MFTSATKTTFQDVQQTCYFGAVAIAWETIGTGIVIFYSSHRSAAYVAEAFFWVAVAMSLAVTCGGVYAIYRRQGQHDLSEVTGAWFLLFIPMIVGAAFGSNLANALSLGNGLAIIVVSYLMLSLGLGLSFLLLGIYLWRLLSDQLPPRAAIVSTFVPVGPFGMSAYVWVNLAVALSRNVSQAHFGFRQTWEPPLSSETQAAVAEMLLWIGVVGALFLLGVASFFLIEAFAAVITVVPKKFNIGVWSFVFPCGVYANAFCRLANLLRNDGMKGWAAACAVFTVLLWLMCATLTFYKAVWQGKLFFAPGLQGWIEEKELEARSKKDGLPRDQALDRIQSSHRSGMTPEQHLRRRSPNNDGSYEPSTIGEDNASKV
ncbi:Plasma membrane sulfite pump involved in sulfite metabolism [Lithohypha guttulata]|nr:Plasma membrane sulfite pump involved in sulfite metabolism [Lithohypha guttulata]